MTCHSTVKLRLSHFLWNLLIVGRVAAAEPQCRAGAGVVSCVLSRHQPPAPRHTASTAVCCHANVQNIIILLFIHVEIEGHTHKEISIFFVNLSAQH